jgi:RecA-family ATPase
MLANFAQRYVPGGHDGAAHEKQAPLDWLVDNMILRGKITGLLGAEKSGKSRLACYILAQMLPTADARNSAVLRWDVGGTWANHHGFKRVLYLNAEERRIDVQARINRYALRLGLPPSNDWPIDYVSAMGMQLQRDSERRAFETVFLESGKYDLLMLDPLRRVHTGDENNNSEMAPLHNDLRRWSDKYGLGIVLTHHTPKLGEDADLERIATWSRGNTDLASLLDGAICLRTTATGADRTIRVMKRLGRFATMPDVQLVDKGDPDGFSVMPLSSGS